MNQARTKHDDKLIDGNNEDKVKWFDYLEEFTGLDVDRMVAALCKLNPSRLDSLVDAANQAKESANQKAIEASYYSMVEKGIDPKAVAKFANEQRKISRAKPKRMTPEQKATVEKIIVDGHLQGRTAAWMMEEIAKQGIEMKQNTFYAKKKVVIDNLEATAASA